MRQHLINLKGMLLLCSIAVSVLDTPLAIGGEESEGRQERRGESWGGDKRKGTEKWGSDSCLCQIPQLPTLVDFNIWHFVRVSQQMFHYPAIISWVFLPLHSYNASSLSFLIPYLPLHDLKTCSLQIIQLSCKNILSFEEFAKLLVLL